MIKMLFLILIAISATAGATTINDSLVQNLECKTLSVNNIYRAIKEDAFNEQRNLPIQNWSFKSGLATIAGCWSLARTQRMVSYLARYNASSEQKMQKRVSVLLDMVRRARLTNECGARHSEPYCEQRLNNYSVFAVEDSSFKENKAKPFGLWNALDFGYSQNFGGKKIRRNFVSDIQSLQKDTFYRLKNTNMIWKNGNRLKSINAETAQRLIQNLDRRRLTLINLRVSINVQHVVMGKSYRKSATDLYEFKVYDSNHPNTDQILYYNPHRKVFFAPDIISGFKEERTFRNLGVFIVDEEDRNQFEAAMLDHYREQCKK